MYQGPTFGGKGGGAENNRSIKVFFYIFYTMLNTDARLYLKKGSAPLYDFDQGTVLCGYARADFTCVHLLNINMIALFYNYIS